MRSIRSRLLPACWLLFVWSHPAIADGEATSEKSRKKSRNQVNVERANPYKSSEAVVRSDQTEIRFDETGITGKEKRPMILPPITGSLRGREKRFVKIRVQWHLEMIQGASHLESEDPETF